MMIFAVFTILSALSSLIDISSHFLSLATPLHTLCLDWAPTSPYTSLYQSFICGADLRRPEWRALFQNTGLIHVLVVSGSHLVWLRELLEFLLPLPRRRREAVLLSLLAFYVVLTGLQPPTVRAWLGLGLQACNQKYKLFWQRGDVILLSGFATLSLFPHWIASLSFGLSWAAALVMHLAQKQKSYWRRSLFVSLAFLPALLPLSWPHPVALLLNMLLLPLLGFGFLGLCFASFLHPAIAHVTDRLWEILLQVLTYCQAHPLPLRWNAFWLALYVVLMQIYVLYQERKT